MLTSGCIVMPRDKGESDPAAFYNNNYNSSSNNNNNNSNSGGGNSNANKRRRQLSCTESPRLRVRSASSSGSKQQLNNNNNNTTQRKPMLLQKHPSRTSQTHIDQIFTNCNTRAMRYYRIWIYTCNAVLLISMLGFCAVAGKTVLGDYRRHLVPSLALYQPSFLYAYLAIFTQSGVLQIVGCLGALRLSERLLNVYWLMLLVLLFGDIVIGIFWMFRLDKMIQELRPGLKFRLYNEYGYNSEWSTLWDRLQTETACCGVQSPLDYATFRSSPQPVHQALLAGWAQTTVIAGSLTPPGASSLLQQAQQHHHQQYQQQHVPSIVINDNTTATLFAPPPPLLGTTTAIRVLVPHACCAATQLVASDVANVTFLRCPMVHPVGCEDRLRTYLKQTSETLFLIGYCVIAFVKICFIGILRYEIREMIQKIKLLKAEMESRPSIASIDLGSSPNIGTTSPSHTVLLSSAATAQNVNGSVRGAGVEGGTESERESLLVQDQETPAHRHHHLHHLHHMAHQQHAHHRTSLSAEDLEFHQHHQQQQQLRGTTTSALHRKLFPGDSGGTGGDSESHCALLVDEGAIKTPPPNGNNNYEMREFQQIHQPTSMVTAQQYTIHNRGYRLSNPDTQTHNM